MKVKHAAIHHLVTKPQFDAQVSKEDAKLVKVKYSKKEHPVDGKAQLNKLIELLEKRLKSAGKGSSKFNDPEINTGSLGGIKEYRNGSLSFFELTKKLAGYLELKTPKTASGSYLTFFEYELEKKTFIFVCALKLEPEVTIDPKTMQVIDATSIRAENVHEGVRICVEDLEAHIRDDSKEEMYIDWINRRPSQKLSNYFQELLDIDYKIDDTQQTNFYKSAVDAYIDDIIQGLEEHTKTIDETVKLDVAKIKGEFCNAAYQIADDRGLRHVSLDFEDVNAVMSGIGKKHNYTHPESFIEYASDNYPKLSNLFKPNRTNTSRWGSIKGEVKLDSRSRIKFEIDRSIVNNKNYVEFDKAEATITIKKVSSSFYSQVS